jgi:putative FmdB family regulatory protein
MPIYEYSCEACGKRSSALLPRFDSPDPACPHCGAPSVSRLVSTFATQRSGEGDFGGDFGDGGDYGEGEGVDDFGGQDGADDWGGEDDF